jgi:tetratricopeptide (TPR) repeat protein
MTFASAAMLAVLAGFPAAAKDYSGPCHRADLDASPIRVIAVCTLELHRSRGTGTYKADLLARRAHAFNRLGLTSSAKHDATKALEHDYRHVPARIRRGYARFWTGQFADGFRDFEDGLLIDPGCATCHVGLAAMHSLAGRRNLAVREQAKAIAVDPHDVQARYIQALYADGAGDRGEARRQIDMALAGGARAVAGRPIYGNITTKLDLYVEIRTFSAILHIMARDNTRALADAEALVSYAPNIARGHAVLGRVRSARGELEEAQKALDMAFALEPRDPFVLWERVRFFERAERPLEALDHMRMLVSISRNDARPRVFVALFLRDGGMFDDAAFALVEAWLLDQRVQSWFQPHLEAIGYLPRERDTVTPDQFADSLSACAIDLHCGRNLIWFGKSLP